jgi:hypothetical protein
LSILLLLAVPAAVVDSLVVSVVVELVAIVHP